MKKTASLRTKVFILFLVATGVVILTFFGMNALVWNVLYPAERRSTMREAYKTMSEAVREGRTSSEDLSTALGTLKQSEGLNFALTGEDDWWFTIGSRERLSEQEIQRLTLRLKMNFFGPPGDNVRVIESTENYTMQEVDLGEDGKYLECYGYMTDAAGQDRKFIFSMPITQALFLSRSMNVFFVVLSLFSLVMSVVLTIFISGRVTKPIQELTGISTRMKNLDFSARYSGDKTDEIGVLGNNMNEMSSQLERTFLKLRLANETLSKDLAEKEQADEMRKDFISSVSHELKTPIALIRGYAEALKEMKDDPESLDYYSSVIADESEKLDHMVRKLTTLNQLEYGQADFSPVNFDLVEMVNSVLSEFALSFRDAGAKISVEGPEELEVLADPFKIEEVLRNYLTNALHYLKEPNEIRLQIADLGPTARVTVENTGDPIPEEELEKIWLKFYKVDRARTRAYGGSGLGLAIVKAIMDAHGREAGVYNTERGVAFWFEVTRA